MESVRNLNPDRVLEVVASCSQHSQDPPLTPEQVSVRACVCVCPCVCVCVSVLSFLFYYIICVGLLARVFLCAVVAVVAQFLVSC